MIAPGACVNGDDPFLPEAQAVSMPGKRAACQADVDRTYTNHMGLRDDEWRKAQPASFK